MALSDSAGVGSALPSQVGVTSGWALTTDGTSASWASVSGGSGVTTMAAVGSSPSANGASISSVTLTLQPADGTHPGVVTATAQTFGGAKTMAGVVSTVGGLVTGVPAAGSASGVALGGDGAFNAPCIWFGTSLTYANAVLADVGGGGVALNAPSGAVAIKNAGTTIAGFGTGGVDMTGMAVGAYIKLRSPDGTTYTATIANGGTWSIA